VAKFDTISGRAVAMATREAYLNGRKPVEYSDEFYTPAWITAALGQFDLDPCAGPIANHAVRNVRPKQNGLKCKWKGRVWLNPPYSSIYEWLDKFLAHGNGICLVNARVDATWFQRLAKSADALFFLRGRVKFYRQSKKTTNPPVGSVLVALGKINAKALADASLDGLLVIPHTRRSASRPTPGQQLLAQQPTQSTSRRKRVRS
jgi:hypothetical protein